MLDKNFPLYILIFATTFLLTFFIEKALIPLLINRAKQPIYSEGPKWHEAKSGTPTMGGLAFLISITVTILSVAIYMYTTKNYSYANTLLLSLIYAIANSIIGLFDDLKKLKRQHNKGLSAKQKLILQTVAAILFLAARSFIIENPTTLTFSFGLLDIGIFYYPISLLIMVGIVNMANLTDGIDGLASGVALSLYDCWEHKELGIFTERFAPTIEPHDCLVVRAKVVER